MAITDKPEVEKTRREQGTRETIIRTVRVKGLEDIMFDRYAGDNDTKLETWQKLYFGDDGQYGKFQVVEWK